MSRRRSTFSIPKGEWGWLRLFLVTSIFAGCQFSWAIQIGYATPTLRELGMSSATAAYAWLAGPMSGIIVQPIIGVWSDHSTNRFGRRRPFLTAGGFLTTISLILFSNSKQLGYLCGDQPQHHSVGLAIAVVSLWLLDFSINIAQAPIRALISDIVPLTYHKRANSAVSINNGIGKSLGYLCGSIDFEISFFSSNIQAVFAIGSVFMFITMLITLFTAKETQYTGIAEDNRGICRVLRDSLWNDLRNLPKPVQKAFVVQFFNYFSWYLIFIFLTDWFGHFVLKGNAQAGLNSQSFTLYEEGVQIGNLALCLMSMLSIVFAIILPYLMNKFNIRFLWIFIHSIFLCGVFTLIFVTTPIPAIIVIVCTFSFHFASLYVIPWWIVTHTITAYSGRGLYTAVFNLCQCLPDILVTLISGPYLVLFRNNLRSIFGLATIGPIAAIIATFYVIIPEEEHDETTDPLFPKE